MTDPQKRERIRHKNPWTWPLVALVSLTLIVIGGTIAALIW